MIKPNLICSHNWHVQPSCQRSVRADRLSGALLDRGRFGKEPVVPELCALLRGFSGPRPFLRELSKPIEVLALCQTSFSIRTCGHPTTPSGLVQSLDGPNGTPSRPFRISTFRAAQSFQTATSIARATQARGESFSPGLAMGLFSEGLPTGVQGFFVRPHPTQRTSFPLPIPGRPNGHREAPSLNLQLVQNSTGYSLLQLAIFLASSTCCSFLRITITGRSRKGSSCGKGAFHVGNFGFLL